MSTTEPDSRILIFISSVTNFNFVSSLLWSNAGFNSLRKLDLEDYEPRYDPTVIPKASESTANAGSSNTLDAVYINGPKSVNRQYTIADYHSAYKSGKLTPTAVAKALLALVPKHKAAFLDVKQDTVLAAAEASTQRYKDGKSRSMLDGVPLSVKGMLSVLFYSAQILDICTLCYLNSTPILGKRPALTYIAYLTDSYCQIISFQAHEHN